MNELAVIGIKIAFVIALALFVLWFSLKSEPEKKITTEQIEYQKFRAKENYATLFYIHHHNLGNQCDAMVLESKDPLEKIYWMEVKFIFLYKECN
jgi:hypothetical protein